MTADIITGPWKKNNQSEKEIQKAQMLAECDGIASDCMVSVLQILVENGMAPEDPDDDNIQNIMFLSEVLKSMIYESVEIDHPFQDVIEASVKKTVFPDNQKQFYVDYHILQEMVDSIKDKKPEKDPA
jgi:hypothetical protein